MRKILWLVVSGLMMLSLLMAACGPAAPATPTTPSTPTIPVAPTTPTTPTTPVEKEAIKPAPEVPKYGGEVRLPQATDITDFDFLTTTAGQTPTNPLTNQELWAGDWAKGPAGGYGTKETSWNSQNYDIFAHKAGFIAESTTWTLDEAKNEGAIVYKIRQGVHWALNPASEASRLVNGRELTADDVIFNLKRVTTNPRAYIYLSNPELRTANITKTGSWEVSVKLPIDALITGISRFGDNMSIYPPEVVTKYGDMNNWRNSVGTGPFMLTEYIPGSAAIFKRNPNYWGKDPVGPGKGNQLPYLDSVRLLVLTDASTRLAAMRTGKVDNIQDLVPEDAVMMRKTTSGLLETSAGVGGGGMVKNYMRTDKAPFNDIRVRKAMVMAMDFKAILQSLYGGEGQYSTWPFQKIEGYESLYLDLNDPDCPEAARELYTYNPEKAKQLLKEAGYPNGFKVSLLCTTTQVDYYSITKDYLSKIGIEMVFDVKETGIYNTIGRERSYESMSTTGGQGPTATFYLGISLAGQGAANGSMINDPYINETLAKIRRMALTDMHQAMVMMRELAKYVIPQAYVIPGVYGINTHFWWPWIKNYSGEKSMGYYNTNNWPQYIWVDQDLKKKMGY